MVEMHQQKLTKENLVLLVIGLARGSTVTPVKLQKAVFLLNEMLPENSISDERFVFTPYHYGPFCPIIYSCAEQLINSGMIEAAQSEGGRYSSFRATDDGVRATTVLCGAVPVKVRDYCEKVVAWVLAQNFASLLRAIYERFPNYAKNSIFEY